MEDAPSPMGDDRPGLTTRRLAVGILLVLALVALFVGLVAIGWVLIRLLFGLGSAAVSGAVVPTG